MTKATFYESHRDSTSPASTAFQSEIHSINDTLIAGGNMQRLLKALLLLVAFMVVGEAAYSQSLPIVQVSGRLPQGTHRVFVKDTLYQISGYYVVSGQLMIEPGTTVEFLPNGRLIDSVGGKIFADGDLDAIWNRDQNAVNGYIDRYCDLGYLTANVSSTGKPEITTPGPNWLGYVPRLLFYYANKMDRCSTDPNRKNVPYLRDVRRAPITFRGRPVNGFSPEWGHIVVLPGADSAIFRNCHFVNFRKDTTVVQSTQFYNPTSTGGFSQAQITAGFNLSTSMRQLTSGGGGAMTVFSSKTWILDCNFDSNFARYHGGAVQFLQAPFDNTGNFYKSAPGVPIGPTTYPPVNPETYDLYGSTITTPLGNIPTLTITTPLGVISQFRQTYDDGRVAINNGRVRRLYFRDNRVVVSNVVNNVLGYRDTTDVAPLNPTGGIGKNEAYGGAIYVSGRRHIVIYLGGGAALRALGMSDDPTDTIVCERNYAVNFQNAGTSNGARGGALFVGDSSSLVFELSRFNDNFTAVPNIPETDYRARSARSQGGGIYMSNTSPRLTVQDNILFRNNKSGQGGGIFVEAIPAGAAVNDPFLSPNLLGDSVYFIANKAEYDGGAIYTQRNVLIEARFLTSIDSTPGAGFPVIDRRIVLDSNSAGLSGGAVVIDNRSNSTNSSARVRRVLFSNNIAGDSARVDAIRQMKLYNPVVSKIRPGFEFGVTSVPDTFHFPALTLSTEILGGGAIWSQNGNTNFYQAVEFRSNWARGGNGGAIGMVLPVRTNRYFLAEGDDAFNFLIGAPVPFHAGPEPKDQREMTRFIRNSATMDSINISNFNPNPAVNRGTLLDPNRNFTGLGGAIYINDRQPPGPNPGTPRVDSVIAHRVRIEQNQAWSGSAVYSDNFELRFRLNKSLVAGNLAVSDTGRKTDTIDNYLTSPEASQVAGALFYGEIEGPIPSREYHTDANSIYDNDARYLVRLPDAPPGAVGSGQSGVDTLRGNYWGQTEAPVTTILPSGTLQNTFYVQGYGCTLPLKNPANNNEQGPFESPRRIGETRPSYVYRSVPIYVIPDTLLMQGRVYDLFDKGLDIKTVDYSNPRLSPIEDFSVGIPPRLRTYATGVYSGKVVRRLTRDPFVAEIDTNYAKLQREYVGNHPIGYPLFLESNANYTFTRDSANDDQYALNHTVFFVINVETGEVIRSNSKQAREGSSIFRSRVEFVADSINRDPLARRTREGRSDFSIGQLYRLTPRYYIQTYAGPNLNTHTDTLAYARLQAARYEDSVALSGRRHGGIVSPVANLELGGLGFRYSNRTNPVTFADIYSGERYHALPVKTGDRIWVISRTMLWNVTDSLVTVLNNAQATGLQFTIDTIGNSVAAPIIYGQRDELENRLPTELRNSRFVVEDRYYPTDKSGRDTSKIFELTANDVNGFFDPRSIFFPDRYTALRYEWFPLQEFSNGTTTPNTNPRDVRLASWLKADTIFPNQPGKRDSARGFLHFWGQPRNPDVVPGGELLEVHASNYPPGIRTIDSLRALADSLRPADSIIARYLFLYPPYYNCQVYDPVTARYLQQDTVDVGGASTSIYRLRIFVQDTPPQFLADIIGCGRNGLPVANLTNKLRFDFDVETDDEREDNNAVGEGWDFRYGRTTYGFIFTDRSYTGNGDSLGHDDVREIRPVWMRDQYLRDSASGLDQGADVLRRGRIKIRIDSLEAIGLLRNPAQSNNAFNLDSIFTLVVNDGHTGENKRDMRVLVNVAPQLDKVLQLPNAKEDYDYNPQLLDTVRRVHAVDLNFNQRVRYTLVYRNDALNPAEYQTGASHPDSVGTKTNTAQIAYVPRDRCYAEAGLWIAPKTTPSWLKVNPFSGLLYGTPGLQDAPHTNALGGPDTVSVIAEDEFGLTDVRTYILEVDSTNHRPRLYGRPAVKCVEAGKPYEDSLCVTDRDLARIRFTEHLTLYVVSPATGFTVDPSKFDGTSKDSLCFKISTNAVPNLPGKLKIKIGVTDGVGNTDTLTYEITISEKLDFGMPIIVRNTNNTDGNALQSLYFGLAPSATTGEEQGALGRLDSNFCEYELPPLPPADVFDSRWTIVTTNGTLRNIFPTQPSPEQGTKIAWKGIFQAGNLPGGSPNYPVVICWSMSDAQKAPHSIFFEDQFWDDSTNSGLFRVNMKNGNFQAGTGITVRRVGTDTICVEINLTQVKGFKIVYDLALGVDDGNNSAIAGGYTLSSNAPNPFSNSTEISYYAPQRGQVQLEVFNINGELVQTLVNSVVDPGEHKVVWNVLDQKNRMVPSGTYTYRLKAGSTVLSKTMVVVK